MNAPIHDSRSHDAVVIGSGFGGAITALRLAEAGHGVLVLERGRRYAPADFPRDVKDTDALLWRRESDRKDKARGLFDLRFLSGIATVSAAGVGGGSLVYAGIHYRPRASVFADPRWPAPFNLETLHPYYERVAASLGVAPLPGSIQLAKRDAFRKAGKQLGRRVEDPPMAVSWEQIFGSGEGRKPCQLCAECEYGCPHGAKNTLDFTILAQAEAQGARVSTGCLVSHIAPAPRGGWEVHYEDLDGGQPRVVTGKRVILCAGTLGSNEILLRSRDLTRTLPRLSHRLGHSYSGNGDFLGNIQNARVKLDPWHGPDVTSVMWHDDDDDLSFVLATPTFNRAVMEVLASHGQAPARSLGPLGPLLWRRLPGLLRRGLRSGLFSKPLGRPMAGAGPAEQMTTVFAIGRDNAGGRLHLRRGKLDLSWAYERENRALISRQRAAMEGLARVYGGTYADFPTWGPFQRTMTVHNLGGCALSTSAESGVVGIDGQVHGHPGLYVADGAVVPTSIGSHPVMTISALAEWIAERVVASFTRESP